LKIESAFVIIVLEADHGGAAGRAGEGAKLGFGQVSADKCSELKWRLTG